MPKVKTRDGAKLNVKVWGEGHPIVFIHGWPLSSDTWDSVALFFAERGYKTIAYDRRGFGSSDHTWKGHDYDTLADDLNAIVEALTTDKFSIFGFSMGGGEAVRYVSRRSIERVSSIVLISSIVPYLTKSNSNPLGVESSAFDEMKKAVREDKAAFFEDFFLKFYGQKILKQPVSPAVVAWSCRLAMQAGLKSTLDCIDSFSQTDFRPELTNIDCPCLLIHGTDDQIVPIDVSSRQAAKAIQKATLVEIVGAGHGLLASHTDDICKQTFKFLKSV